MLTAERLREVLNYDPETGVFTWKERLSNRIHVGDVVGWKNNKENDKSIETSIEGRRYPLHRLAWLYVYGEWPADLIDHINGNARDNRIANLRPASKLENNWNTKKSKRNTSGYKGVSFNKAMGRWVASIRTVDGQLTLGYFEDREKAHAEYVRVAKIYRGEFACDGERV